MAFILSKVSVWSYAFAALLHGLFTVYLLAAWHRRIRGGFLILASLATALWAASNWSFAVSERSWLFHLANAFDALRLGAWYGFLVLLLMHQETQDGSAELPSWPRSLSTLVAGISVLAVGCFALEIPVYDTPLRTWAAASLLTSVFGLVLLEQFYRSVSDLSRWGVKPLTIGLAGLFAFDVYLFSDTLLFSRINPAIWSVRGFAHTLAIPLVALSASRNPEWTFRVFVSRDVVFHSTAIAGSSLYLLLLSGAGYYMRFFGGEWGQALQLAFLFGGALLLGVVILSGAYRARLKVWLSKHFFAYRYDYRREWLNTTQALSGASDGLGMGESVVKLLADLVESPGGGVWLKDAHGCYSQQARLNMPHSGVQDREGSDFIRFLLEREWVMNLEEMRAGHFNRDEVLWPEWVSQVDDVWLIVPLISSGGLVGFVVLLSPRTPVDVNWEVLDLLKMAGRQAASYFAQMQAAEALLEARKFDAFNRMSAFVVHDLKNLVAQMSLMLRNAERHKDNPEFQADMLETVRHVEARMRGLMAQLMEKTSINQPRPVHLRPLLERLVHARRQYVPRPRFEPPVGDWAVLAHPERLERILGHIVQNALDATLEHGTVSVHLSGDVNQACITVLDTGCGMSPAFIRDQLFKPFQTTKASGMGIGAYEVQQYIRELGGELHVDSEVSAGTRFQVLLPLAPDNSPRDTA
ncbi:XrtA/PEP-CTERM system histidine kinase PrsK [Zoogloea sp.]|uniref:XrtA/PEP-CTERM system histidine kinase PrsK n=1 Tax=Zoogloea sp. TaxID=49181 RepID=UPI0035B114DE